jgi:hypothetical protein
VVVDRDRECRLSIWDPPSRVGTVITTPLHPGHVCVVACREPGVVGIDVGRPSDRRQPHVSEARFVGALD